MDFLNIDGLQHYHSLLLGLFEKQENKNLKSTKQEALSGTAGVTYFTTDTNEIILNGISYGKEGFLPLTGGTLNGNLSIALGNLLSFSDAGTISGDNGTLNITSDAVDIFAPVWADSLEANTIKKTGGTDQQVLMADGSVKELSEMSGGSAGGGMVEVTHAQLKAMRDSGQLVAGQQYRITDYVATTTDPESRSANHPFDIIVTADNERTLNESARAIAHAGDTYFEKCNLSAWQLMYCIDNDTSRFAWAQEGGEFYVFNFSSLVLKAELFSTEDTTHAGYPYRFVAEAQGEFAVIYSPELSFNEDTNCYLEAQGQTQLIPFNSLNKQVFEDGKGVIFRMIDENNNDFSCDFKGIQFKRYKVVSSDTEELNVFIGRYASKTNVYLNVDENDYRWCYVFNVMMDDIEGDDSVGFYLGVPCNCKYHVASGLLINGVCMQDLTSQHSCSDWSANQNGWTCGNECTDWKSNGSDWVCGNQCIKWVCGHNNGWCAGDNCSIWECKSGDYTWCVGNECLRFTILSHGYFVSKAAFPFVKNAKYPQFASRNSNGELKVWNPADLVQ